MTTPERPMSPEPQTITLVTRSSPLARVQVDEACRALAQHHPDWRPVVHAVESPGDRDQTRPLTDATVPDDFFTRDLDDALRRGDADLAVHSAKDLPQQYGPDLTVAALLPARDIRDAVVLRAGVARAEVRVVGTSSPGRIAAVAACWPQAETRSIRGTIDQRLAQLDAGGYDAVIVAACALERLGLAARIDHYLPCDPAPQQGRLALVVRSDRTDLLRALRPLDVRRTAGLVAIVGCPADATLLSERARRYLEQADCVVHDRLLPPQVMAWIKGKAIPVGKDGGGDSTPQSEIHRRLLQAAEQGLLVVRLQGGDPLIFAHLSEQLEFLEAWNIRVDLVPSLTAAQVAGAHALAPLTHRRDGGHLHLMSGHETKGEPLPPLPAPGAGNLAIYMSVTKARRTAQRLLTAGWPADTAVVIGECLGHADEAIRTVPLQALGEVKVRRPAVFLVGPRPHAATAPTLFVGNDPDHFLKHGPLIHWPLIRLTPRPLAERLEKLERCWSQVAGVVFPSRIAVRIFMETVLARGDARDLAGKQLLAVGPATAGELQRYGLRADAAVDGYGGLSALVAGPAKNMSGTYLYPCSSIAPLAQRRDTLREAGLEAVAETFYDNEPVPRRPLPDRPFGRVLFTSTSTVDIYFDYYPEETARARIWLSVGPSTTRALHTHGLEVQELT